MKIIHCADIHLGSKIDGFPEGISKERKQEVRDGFLRMVAYARAQDVKVIMLSGDVFDREKPYKKDTDFFYDVVEANEDIDFLYLRGNHDLVGEERALPNLKTFSAQWESYDFGEVVISGIELVKENERSYASTLSLDGKRKNIVMLHGQIGEEINLVKLRDKNIDYLALGHIHEYVQGEIDGRGRYAYSGCLVGRGFDETGDKGFLLLEVGERIAHTFVSASSNRIEKVELDVGGLKEGFAMSRLAREKIPFQKDGIYRVELVGEVDADAENFASETERYLASECAYISVKDRTKKKIDYDAFEGDNSLRGEFVRTVRESEEYTDEEKAQIIVYGLRALAGREVIE